MGPVKVVLPVIYLYYFQQGDQLEVDSIIWMDICGGVIGVQGHYKNIV